MTSGGGRKFPIPSPKIAVSPCGRAGCQNWLMLFATYNIQYSKGKDGLHNLDRAVDEIHQADIVGLQEVVRNGPGMPDADQPERVAELFDGYHWVYGPAVDLDGGSPGVRRQFGNIVLSRWPILASRLLLLPRVRSYDRTSLERCALEAVIDAPGGPLRVYSVHLDDLNPRHRTGQITTLLDIVFSASETGTSLTGPGWQLLEPPVPPVPIASQAVVLGDFNMLPGSGEYDDLVGIEDYYRHRTITGDRLVDTWTLMGHDLADGVTWRDGDIAVKLDYVFVTPGLAPGVVATHIDVSAVGSDHQPVWMQFDGS